jgi:hypothetical protein
MAAADADREMMKEKEKSMSTIRVMTFNINGSRSEEADTNAWQKRAALNVKTIKRHAPRSTGSLPALSC